jgi:hypothetical protein
MKKVLVSILGLSYSQTQNGAYAVVLSEAKGKKRKLPIIVNANDAQAIALKLEGIKTQRPMTHDLFKSFVDAFNADLVEVYIYSVVEGLFYSKLIFNNGLDDIAVECSIGDALSLATLFQSPIYVAEFVMTSAGITMDDEIEVIEIEEQEDKPKKTSVEELETMLNRALSDEDYEVAAQLRDKINKMKQAVKK